MAEEVEEARKRRSEVMPGVEEHVGEYRVCACRVAPFQTGQCMESFRMQKRRERLRLRERNGEREGDYRRVECGVERLHWQAGLS